MSAPATQKFRASFFVQEHEGVKIVTDRIACRQVTRTIGEKVNSELLGQNAFRKALLQQLHAACPPGEKSDAIAKKFLHLAHTLEHAKALGLPAVDTSRGEDDSSDPDDSSGLEDSWTATVRELGASGSRLLDARSDDAMRHPITQAGTVHPLIVALLAFRLGGPINAANSAFAHQWKLPDQSASIAQEQHFHMEGDAGNIFDDHRITFVWENRQGQVKRASGAHHLFLTGEGTPRCLNAATVNTNFNAGIPQTILYDMRNASLVYECQDEDPVRHSISLDFHLQSTSDEDNTPDKDRGLFSGLKPEDVQPDSMELIDLLTSYPVPGYKAHFQRLLGNPKSIGAIIQMLSRLDPPALCPRSSSSHEQYLRRVESCKQENLAKIPPEILSIKHDVQVSGRYSFPAGFLQNLARKACRDVHLPLGWDLFPHELTDGGREIARKYFRDLPERSVAGRIESYTCTLMKMPNLPQDLLSTEQLQNLANHIAKGSWELVSDGYVSTPGILPYIPSFVQALGSVLNGRKEAQHSAEAFYDATGFQIYRSRCLYLFWCVDFLVNYLGKPIEGPHMVGRLKMDEIVKMKSHADTMARLLLRNWVAWGLFVEGLPKDGFRVGASTA